MSSKIKYHIIYRHKTEYPVAVMCKFFGVALYEALATKSPRMFLKNVIRAQLKEYFDGKLYGDGWYFPMNPSNAQMANDPHSSAIDRLENISTDDKNRLKAVFAIWGDGSAAGVSSP